MFLKKVISGQAFIQDSRVKLFSVQLILSYSTCYLLFRYVHFNFCKFKGDNFIVKKVFIWRDAYQALQFVELFADFEGTKSDDGIVSILLLFLPVV